MDLEKLNERNQQLHNQFFLESEKELRFIFDSLQEKKLLPLLWKPEIIWKADKLEESEAKIICIVLAEFFSVKKELWASKNEYQLMIHTWSNLDVNYTYGKLIPDQVHSLCRTQPELETLYPALWSHFSLISKLSMNQEEITQYNEWTLKKDFLDNKIKSLTERLETLNNSIKTYLV